MLGRARGRLLSAWLGGRGHSLLNQMEDTLSATFSSIGRRTGEGNSESESPVFIRKPLSRVLLCTKEITTPERGSRESELLTIHQSDLDGSGWILNLISPGLSSRLGLTILH